MQELEREYAERAAMLQGQLEHKEMLAAKAREAASPRAGASIARQSTSKLLEDLALTPVPPLASIAESASLGAGAAGGDAAVAPGDGAVGGELAAGAQPSARGRAKAIEQAKAAAEKKKLESAKGAGMSAEGVKALREAEKKNRQLEASAQKLQAKVAQLEQKVAQSDDKISSLKAGAGAGAAAAAGGAAAKGGNPAKMSKELENAKKREDKYKAELEATAAKLAELEKAQKKSAKELQTAAESAKALEAATQALAEAKKLQAEAEAKAAEADKAYAEVEASYKKEMQLRKKYYNQIEDMKGKIRVYARCRPFAAYEKERQCKLCLHFKDDMSCAVDIGNRADGRPKDRPEFTFDEIFRMDSSQQQIFDGVSHLVQSAVDGYNVCIFAYGQTGSGKTFTMYGKRDDPDLQGIAPRAMRELFDIIAQEKDADISVSCYMLELYNDQLVDLLADKNAPKEKLDVKLDKRGVVVVSGASVRGPCRTFEELYKWNERGMAQRHVASTAMNAESSRSHLVFSVLVQSKNKTTGAVALGKLTLVDLAGSERQSKTQATGDRLKEAKSINMSLSALGDVISALSTGEKFVPYRNNLLTKLLQDGLGGNAKTLMFVNISPADYNMEETVTSLQYAQRVKLITNEASKAAESAEIQKLKAIITDLKKGKDVDIDAELGTPRAAHDKRAGARVDVSGGAPELHEEEAPGSDVDDDAWMEGPAFERNNREIMAQQAGAEQAVDAGDI